MKPPKNFYSNLDRRKQGLPEVPEASAADAGKIIKVGEDGAYELGEDSGLPAVTSSDNYKVLQVIQGTWDTRTVAARSFVVGSSSGSIVASKNTGITVNVSESLTFLIFNQSASISIIIAALINGSLPIYINDRGTEYRGFTSKVTSDTIYALVSSDGITLNEAIITASSVTYTQVGSIKYYEIETSGSSVSLPSGVTFADVYAELLAGVDVKFTSGARVYSVTSFESTNIRAHWMSDLDLTNMDVSVINLESDGTGTVKTVTFSGT